MDIETFDIPGVVLVKPKVFGDHRGYFMEAYKRAAFNEAVGYEVDFIQDNQSMSAQVGTVRGLHYQSPPHAQGKLVRCLSGTIVDVAVDARVGSPTYGQHVRVELTDENQHQLWVPPGFLHGFSTLTPNVTVMYKVTDIYSPANDGGVYFDDTELGIDWGFDVSSAALSDKDKAAPKFADWESPFTYEG